MSWLAEGHRAAVCFSVDDVHPARSRDHFEAGGDLSDGVLGRLERLLERHPQLRATLFMTPDWRERSPFPTRTVRASIPYARDHLHLTSPLRGGPMRLDRHAEFVAYVRAHPQFEVAVHGLSHLARGRRPTAEFERLGERRARHRLRRARALFAHCGLNFEDGFGPPGWDVSPGSLRALAREGFRWLSAARDIDSPVLPGTPAAGSGLRGVPLYEPGRVPGTELVHFPINFQATSSDARACAIIELGGLLSVKAHAIKDAAGHTALDGLDHAYADRLDRLFTLLERRYGDTLWWTTMGALATRVAPASDDRDAVAA